MSLYKSPAPVMCALVAIAHCVLCCVQWGFQVLRRGGAACRLHIMSCMHISIKYTVWYLGAQVSFQASSSPLAGRPSRLTCLARMAVSGNAVEWRCCSTGDIGAAVQQCVCLHRSTAPARRKPYHGVNFVIAHDGFTLHDLVAYNAKHNDANGEGNRDGSNDNFSWNCGVVRLCSGCGLQISSLCAWQPLHAVSTPGLLVPVSS